MDSILQIPSSDSTAGDARATVGSSESHVHRQLAIQRRNLLTICRWVDVGKEGSRHSKGSGWERGEGWMDGWMDDGR